MILAVENSLGGYASLIGLVFFIAAWLLVGIIVVTIALIAYGMPKSLGEWLIVPIAIVFWPTVIKYFREGTLKDKEKDDV